MILFLICALLFPPPAYSAENNTQRGESPINKDLFEISLQNDDGYTLLPKTSPSLFRKQEILIPRNTNVTINGRGFYLLCENSNNKIFDLQENSTLTFKNILIKNFNINNFKFENNSKVIFDENCSISLKYHQTLTQQTPIIISGQLLVAGNDSQITFQSQSCKILKNAKLIIQRCHLKQLGPQSIDMHDSSILVLDNSQVSFFLNTLFSQGSLKLKNKVLFTSSNPKTALTKVAFQNNVKIEIEKESTLLIPPSIIIAFVDETVQLLFSDNTSSIFLDSCEVEVGNNGFTFNKGTIVINDLVKFTSPFYAPVIFKENLVKILPGSNLMCDGPTHVWE